MEASVTEPGFFWQVPKVPALWPEETDPEERKALEIGSSWCVEGG